MSGRIPAQFSSLAIRSVRAAIRLAHQRRWRGRDTKGPVEHGALCATDDYVGGPVTTFLVAASRGVHLNQLTVVLAASSSGLETVAAVAANASSLVVPLQTSAASS